MMTRIALAVLTVLGGTSVALAGAGAARAGDMPTPLCGRPAVLEQVGAVLAQAGRRIVLDPYPVGEVSTAPSRLVACAVRGRVVAYDTPRYGTMPVEDIFVVRYTLELRRHGIFLRVQ